MSAHEGTLGLTPTKWGREKRIPRRETGNSISLCKGKLERVKQSKLSFREAGKKMKYNYMFRGILYERET